MVILLLFLFANPLFAEETRYYLVYRSSFSEFNTIKSQGVMGRKQPMQNVELLTAPNTNYAILQITPTNNTQRTVLQGLVDTGKIRLIQTNEVVERMDSRTGGLQQSVDVGVAVPLPTDFYTVWRSS